jgi:hypothetical protein
MLCSTLVAALMNLALFFAKIVSYSPAFLSEYQPVLFFSSFYLKVEAGLDRSIAVFTN